MAKSKSIAARRKLLACLPRGSLDNIAPVDNPWNYDRPSLIDVIASRWTEVRDDVRDAIDATFRNADKES